MKVTIDSVTYESKPSKLEISRITNRMIDNTVDLTPKQFRKEVLFGKTWCPAVFDGRRRNDNFRQCEVFALDFDKGMTPEAVMTVCRELGIPPFFVYYSYSHSPALAKFRICWRLDKPVGDLHAFGVVQNALMSIFKRECDLACKDAARMYFGTSKGEYHFDPEAVLTPERIVDALCEYIHVSAPAHATRDIRAFVGYHQLPNTPGGLPILQYKPNVEDCLSTPDAGDGQQGSYTLENGESKFRTYRFYTTNTPFHQKHDVPVAGSRPQPHTHTLPSAQRAEGSDSAKKWKVDLDLLCARCTAFRELRSGLPLDHNLTYCLAKTLLKIKGGEREIKAGLQARAEYSQESYQRKWTYQLKKLKEYNYPISWCESFCSHYAECKPDGFTPLDQVPAPRGVLRRLRKELQEITHAEAIERVRQAVADAVSAIETLISLIIAPPGCGKSTAVAGLRNVLHVVPTHDLALERVQAIEKATGVKPVYVPPLPALPSQIRNKLEAYWRIGAKSKASWLVHHLTKNIRKKPKEKRTPEDRALIEYADAVTWLNQTNVTAVITHERFATMRPTKHEIIVIDEDVMPSLVQLGRISLKDLLYLKSRAACCGSAIRQPIEDIVKVVEDTPEGELRRHVQRIIESSEKLVDFVANETLNLRGDVIGFFASDIWIKVGKGGDEVVHFASVPKLPEDKKIIVLSATADPDIYRKVFGDRVVITEIGPVELMGELLQDPSDSYSRSKLYKPDCKKALLDQLHIEDDEQVITYCFMKDDEALKNVEKKLYFHKLLGVNRLAGQNLVILGTPHVTPVVYHLYAAALGYQVTVFDQQSLTYSKIRRNGWEFDFMTFSDDPDLQRIQLWLIEGELIQAVGRARLHNYNCSVRVYSDYILPQAMITSFATTPENGVGSGREVA